MTAKNVLDRIGDLAELGDDFTKFSKISQWFQTLIHPALMQRPRT
ncbi:hypothetical protein RintRC_5667 [Richelia intracellularis]|nr:hypothetical protein RintRC_5667 [Richelia intracellularis]